MTSSLRLAFRTLNRPFRNDLLRLSPPLSSQAARFLYAKETLGIDGFNESRKNVKDQMRNIDVQFRERMNAYTTDDCKNKIFTEDLKNMMHLAENDADVELVVKMAKKFNGQNKELTFGSYVFGPVMMRMFHVHDKADLALECFKSPELNGLLDQLISYQILMDLLYENQKYQEVLEVFDIVKGKQLEGAKFPRNAVVLVMAACYKLNSKESGDYAFNLWNDLLKVGHFPMRRATTFCAGLALNQGKPDIAVEIMSAVKNPTYVTVRNLKAKALTDLGRVEEAIALLKSVISTEREGEVAQTFNRDVVECVKAAVAKLENPELSLEFNRLEKLFESEGHISEMTLDSQLCSEIQRPPMMNYRNRQANQYSRYNPDQSRGGYQRYNPDQSRRNPQRYNSGYNPDQSRNNAQPFRKPGRPGLDELN